MTTKTRKKPVDKKEDIAVLAGRALRRAAKRAREIARMHGTKVWVVRDGKVVGEKP